MTALSARPSSAFEQPLPAGEVHIWLSRPTPSPDSGRFLGLVLSRYTGLPQTGLQFERGQYGKPLLIDSPVPLQFSLSHSGGFTACAVALHTPLGLDLEYRDGERDLLKLARRFYHSSECRQLQALDDERRAGFFYDLWALKEAWVKARGGALGRDLAATVFRLDAPAGAIEKVPAEGDEGAYCCLLQGPAGYSLALCQLAPGLPQPRIRGFHGLESGETHAMELPVRACTCC